MTADPDRQWLDEMTAWVDRCLDDAGIHRRGAIDHVRSWARAALLTFVTDRGRMWAKAVPEVFAHEIAVTLLLADVDPGIVPPVVAADRARGRVITEHVEGPVLSTGVDDPLAWTATLSRLAEVQRVLSLDIGALAIAGVATAPLTRLADDVPRLLADDELLLVGRSGGLTTAEAGSPRGRASALAAACRRLAASGVPDSLEHGDLSASQVVLGEMGPVFLDWSDGSVTHPFLSAAAFLDAARRSVRPVPASEDDLVDAYLAPWIASGVVSRDTGRTALDLAMTVLPLHVASMYADRILPALARTDGLARRVPHAMRSLL